MEQITAEGLRVANDLSQRYGFSQEAVVHMMAAILRGRGGMAQFNHPEFAGSGQWMQGGMLMIGDMFNNGLKARVDGLCQAIAAVLGSQSDLFPVGSFQSQNQSGPGQQQQVGSGLGQQMQVGGGTQQQSRPAAPTPTSTQARSPLFVPDPRDSWWPRELGTPNATGEQNNVRYAYFGDCGRLAVEANGQLNVYDTGEHRISGFSQQQTPAGAVVFSTPAGTVSLSSLSSASATASGRLPAGPEHDRWGPAAGEQGGRPATGESRWRFPAAVERRHGFCGLRRGNASDDPDGLRSDGALPRDGPRILVARRAGVAKCHRFPEQSALCGLSL